MTSSKIFYIFVSRLAQHTRDLEAIPQVSIMLIEDEKETRQIFARRRLTFQCRAMAVPRETDEWQQAAEQFHTRLGALFDLIRNLADFQMFKLEPQEGQFVLGFGQAYRVTGDDLDTLGPPRTA